MPNAVEHLRIYARQSLRALWENNRILLGQGDAQQGAALGAFALLQGLQPVVGPNHLTRVGQFGVRCDLGALVRAA